MTTKKEREEAEARDTLLNVYGIKPGDTIYTSLKHVSRSGMYRAIRLYIVKDGSIVDISWFSAKLIGRWDDNHRAVGTSGCGMDMGFHLVYSLGWALFGKEWECVYPDRVCSSNDHTNEWNSPRGKGVIHYDGGYALKQEWM